jgi:sporulation protein YlmC with PRC-barrel domain
MKTLAPLAVLMLFVSGIAIAQPAPPTAMPTPPPPETAQPMPPTPKITQPMAAAPEAAQIMPMAPSDSMSLTEYYKQDVYDPSDDKIGEVMDILMDKSGRVTAAILAVGGFLGIGEKDVAVSFNALQMTQKNDKRYLVVNTTKEALEKAPSCTTERRTSGCQKQSK